MTALLILAGPAWAATYDGAELYALNCSNCHGVYGEGNGIVTPDLSVVVMDLRYLAERNGGVFPREFVTRIIDGREVRAAHGPEGMPVWGAVFSRGEGLGEDAQRRVDEKIGAITDFLESIQIVE
ncbi:MAG: cytochrome c [Pseudomonadales bacterium]